MKSYRLFFYVSFILSAVLLVSCDDEPLDVGLNIELEAGEITAKIAGEDVLFDGTAAYTPLDSAPLEGGEGEGEDFPNSVDWNIKGESQDDAKLSVFLANTDMEPNIFDLVDNGEDAISHTLKYTVAMDTTMSEIKVYKAVSGVVNIREIDLEEKTISGTFNAILELEGEEGEEEEPIEITNGKITKVKFTEKEE